MVFPWASVRSLVSGLCGRFYGLSGGVAVGCAVAVFGRGSRGFSRGVAVNGLVAAGRGCPDDFSCSITNGLPLVAERDGGQQKEG